jgi:hypothetical protein
MYDPTIPSPAARGGLAPRPPDLRGRRVGLLENSKRNSDRILERVGEHLAASGAEVVGLWRKPTTHPVAPAILDEMVARCDLVVTGVGD